MRALTSASMVVASLAVAASGMSCGGSSARSSSEMVTPIAAADVVTAVASGLNGIGSVHADTELIAFNGNASAVLARVETWADLDAGEASRLVSEPVQPLSDEFVVTEEMVHVDGVTFRRSNGREWSEVDEQIHTMVLTVLDTSEGDFETALTAFVLAVPSGWTVSSEDDGAETYRSDPQPDGTFVEVHRDAEGRPARFVVEQRPTGANLDDRFPRYRTIVNLTGFHETVVELPSDLPAT